MTIFKTIKEHAGKYLTGSIFTAVVSLLMMKYYTNVFSPSQFGILALYMIMFEYVKALVSLNMDHGTTRLYFDYKEKRRDEYLSTIFWFLIMLSVIVSIIGFVLMPYVPKLIASNSEDVYIITIIVGIIVVFVTFFMRILINEHRSTSVLKHTIAQSLINHLSSVIFISIFNLGIFGRLSGQGLGAFFNLYGLIKEFSINNFFNIKMMFNASMAKETFLLSLPLSFLYFQNIFFVYLDRIFLKYFYDDNVVGIYTLGYLLGQGLSMVYNAISQAILPKVYNDLKENYQDNVKKLESFSYRYYIGLFLLTIIISYASPLVVDLVANEDYSQAAIVMPYIIISFMMGGFYKIPSLILGFHKIVWIFPFVSFFSFGTKALLSWWLIPIYGMLAAAFASFIGLYLYSLSLQLFTFKFLSKKYKIVTIIGYIGILIFVSIMFLIGII